MSWIESSVDVHCIYNGVNRRRIVTVWSNATIAYHGEGCIYRAFSLRSAIQMGQSRGCENGMEVFCHVQVIFVNKLLQEVDSLTVVYPLDFSAPSPLCFTMFWCHKLNVAWERELCRDTANSRAVHSSRFSSLTQRQRNKDLESAWEMSFVITSFP